MKFVIIDTDTLAKNGFDTTKMRKAKTKKDKGKDITPTILQLEKATKKMGALENYKVYDHNSPELLALLVSWGVNP